MRVEKWNEGQARIFADDHADAARRSLEDVSGMLAVEAMITQAGNSTGEGEGLSGVPVPPLDQLDSQMSPLHTHAGRLQHWSPHMQPPTGADKERPSPLSYETGRGGQEPQEQMPGQSGHQEMGLQEAACKDEEEALLIDPSRTETDPDIGLRRAEPAQLEVTSPESPANNSREAAQICQASVSLQQADSLLGHDRGADLPVEDLGNGLPADGPRIKEEAVTLLPEASEADAQSLNIPSIAQPEETDARADMDFESPPENPPPARSAATPSHRLAFTPGGHVWTPRASPSRSPRARSRLQLLADSLRQGAPQTLPLAGLRSPVSPQAVRAHADRRQDPAGAAHSGWRLREDFTVSPPEPTSNVALGQETRADGPPLLAESRCSLIGCGLSPQRHHR